MTASVIAFIQNLFGGNKGLNALNTTLDQRLTASRALGLDNLVNIAAGPAALQANLGTPEDALTSPTAWAIAQEIERLICDIETQLQLLNSGQNGIAVFNINTMNTTAVQPPATPVTGGAGNAVGPEIISWNDYFGGYSGVSPFSGANTPLPLGNVGFDATGLPAATVANPMDAAAPPTGTGIGSDNISGIGQTLFSPSLAQQQLQAPAVKIATGISPAILAAIGTTGIATTATSSTGVGGIFLGSAIPLTPINGCNAQLPTGVYVTVNGANPTLTGDIYPFTLGQVGATPYIGIKRAANNHWYFVAMATVGGSEASVLIDIISGGVGTGNIAWPVQFYWPGNSALPALQDAQGHVFTLSAGSAPAATVTLAPVIQVMNGSSGFYHAAVGYV